MTVEVMKAASLWQPFASFVAEGVKPLETRSWATSYRGPLAIAASATIPTAVRRDVLGQSVRRFGPAPGDAVLLNALYRLGYRAGGDPDGRDLPLGAVVAVCVLEDVLPIIGVDGEHPLPEDGRVLVVEGDRLEEWHATDGALDFPVCDESYQLPFGDFRPGRFAWCLNDVVKLDEPVAAKGRLGLWDWTPPAHLELGA